MLWCYRRLSNYFILFFRRWIFFWFFSALCVATPPLKPVQILIKFTVIMDASFSNATNFRSQLRFVLLITDGTRTSNVIIYRQSRCKSHTMHTRRQSARPCVSLWRSVCNQVNAGGMTCEEITALVLRGKMTSFWYHRKLRKHSGKTFENRYICITAVIVQWWAWSNQVDTRSRTFSRRSHKDGNMDILGGIFLDHIEQTFPCTIRMIHDI